MDRYCIRINRDADTWRWWSDNNDHGAGWTDNFSERNAFTMDRLVKEIQIIRTTCGTPMPTLTIYQVAIGINEQTQ
jgi:hypothetical protein